MDELQQKKEIMDIMRKNSDMIAIPAKVRRSKEFMSTCSFSPEIGQKAYDAARSLLSKIGANNTFFSAGKRKAFVRDLEKTLMIWLSAMSQPNQKYEGEYLSTLDSFIDFTETETLEPQQTDTPKERALLLLSQTAEDLAFYQQNKKLDGKLDAAIDALKKAMQLISASPVTSSAAANECAAKIAANVALIRKNVANGLTVVVKETDALLTAANGWNKMKDLSASKVKDKDLIPPPDFGDELNHFKAFVTDVEPRVNDFFSAMDDARARVKANMDSLRDERRKLTAERQQLADDLQNGVITKDDAIYQAKDLQARFAELDESEQMLSATGKEIVDNLSYYTNNIKRHWNTCKLTMSGSKLNEIFGSIDYGTIISALHVGGTSLQEQSNVIYSTLQTIKSIDKEIDQQIALWEHIKSYGEKEKAKAPARRVAAKVDEKADEQALDWLLGGKKEVKADEKKLPTDLLGEVTAETDKNDLNLFAEPEKEKTETL